MKAIIRTILCVSIGSLAFFASSYSSYATNSQISEATAANTPASNYTNWEAIAMSDNGSHLAAVSPDGIYLSTDQGVTWKINLPTHSTGNWTGIALSADGKTMLASDSGCLNPFAENGYGGYLFISSDFGNHFQAISTMGVETWSAVSSSSSGQYLAATTTYSCSSGSVGPKPTALPESIYTSTDFGKTWVLRKGAGSHPWNSIVSSGDGKKLVATSDDALMISSNFGITWSKSTPGKDPGYLNPEISTDGSHVIAVENTGGTTLQNNFIVGTTNFGKTWKQISPAGLHDWDPAAISSDGNKIIAVDYGGFRFSQPQKQLPGNLYSSSDFGKTWSVLSQRSDGYWSNIVGNNSDTSLMAIGNQDLFFSGDSGKTWVVRSNELSRTWITTAMSQDGSFLIGASYWPGCDSCGREDGSPDWFVSKDRGNDWIGYGTDLGLSSQIGQNIVDINNLFASSSGSTLYAVSGLDASELEKSINYGSTWVIQPEKLYSTVFTPEFAMNGDSSVIAYIGEDNNLYITTDSGKSWTLRTPASFVDGVDGTVNVSSDGSLILVDDGLIRFVSKDHGITWKKYENAWHNGTIGVCLNSTGKLIAVLPVIQYPSANSVPQGLVDISNDFGATFEQVNIKGSTNLGGVACDGSGQYLATSDGYTDEGTPGYIYTSSDFGKTWQPKKGSGLRIWNSLKISSDGKVLSTIGSPDPVSPFDSGRHLYLSSDSGNTWTDLSLTGKETWANQ